MNKNFEDEYRDYAAQQAPDLWARIEANLPDKKRVKAIVEDPIRCENDGESEEAVETSSNAVVSESEKTVEISKNVVVSESERTAKPVSVNESIVTRVKEEPNRYQAYEQSAQMKRARILKYSGMAAAVFALIIAVPFLMYLIRGGGTMNTAKDGMAADSATTASEDSARCEEKAESTGMASEEAFDAPMYSDDMGEEAKSDTNRIQPADSKDTANTAGEGNALQKDDSTDAAEPESQEHNSGHTNAEQNTDRPNTELTEEDYSLRIDNVTIEIISMEKQEDKAVACAKVIADESGLLAVDSEILVAPGEMTVVEGEQYTVALVNRTPWMSVQIVYEIAE